MKYAVEILFKAFTPPSQGSQQDAREWRFMSVLDENDPEYTEEALQAAVLEGLIAIRFPLSIPDAET